MGVKAVLIGINYPGTKAELKGCVNDVKRMHACLLRRCSFSADDISILIDTDPSYQQPTGRNIRLAISNLVHSSLPGDSLFLHYSGHGTRLPSTSSDDDDTGFDECIVPSDFNLITDDDFRGFVNLVPKGCRITIVSDSCHSGGLIDECKEQIGESSRGGGGGGGGGGEGGGNGFSFRGYLYERAREGIAHVKQHGRRSSGEEDNGGGNRDVHVRSRSLPLSTLIEIMKQKTGKEDIDEGKLRPALFDLFGEDASPKVKKFMEAVMGRLGGGGGLMGAVGELAGEFLKQKLGEKEEGRERGKGMMADAGILISGCQTEETSADASPVGGKGEAYGALSNAIQEIIEESRGGEVTNQEIVRKAREVLKRQGFTQRPGLYCSDDHLHSSFLPSV